MDENKVALCVIATAKYRCYVPELAKSVRQWFLRGYDVSIFLFTDGPPLLGTIHVPVEHEQWPGPTLHRFHMMLKSGPLLEMFDHAFYVDADTRFVDTVGEEILGDGLTAVIHQGFHDKGREHWTFETREESRAYVPMNEGQHYYAGGFQGGWVPAWLEAMKWMRDAIDEDERNGIVPIWADESIWNAYLIRHPPVVKLPPSYCTDEGNPMPGAKLLALRKDHAAMRS